jgi:hypothetical protein
MSEWGRNAFGDPCRDCSFEWSLSRDEAVAVMRRLPGSLHELLDGADDSRRHPDLGWTVKEYVCHVADNLRVSSERLVAAARGGSSEVQPYDQDLLAVARNYAGVPIEGALWSLERAIDDWAFAIEHAAGERVVLLHPERGRQTVLDVCLNNVHDGMHHRWDIARTLGRSET